MMGLLTDTHMDTSEFSYLALAFYMSYLFFELPTGYLMQRLPTTKYLGLNVILWGLITTLNCTPKGFPGLLVLRILLSCCKSAIAPAIRKTLRRTPFKKLNSASHAKLRKEQPKRMGFCYLGMGTATISGALVAIAVVLFLPDNPISSYLTHQEKLVVIECLCENKIGIENKHFKMEQFLESWKDPQTYLIILLISSMMVPNDAISSFSAILIKAFGYTTKQTELLSISGGVIPMIFILTGTYFAGKYDQRCL
ncbi:hypothetical protein CDV55_100466 [Aspergillus turcosus]|nr:hypothetical protein CDV55_100466 [Aspergillus turcosus]